MPTPDATVSAQIAALAPYRAALATSCGVDGTQVDQWLLAADTMLIHDGIEVRAAGDTVFSPGFVSEALRFRESGNLTCPTAITMTVFEYQPGGKYGPN